MNYNQIEWKMLKIPTNDGSSNLKSKKPYQSFEIQNVQNLNKSKRLQSIPHLKMGWKMASTLSASNAFVAMKDGLFVIMKRFILSSRWWKSFFMTNTSMHPCSFLLPSFDFIFHDHNFFTDALIWVWQVWLESLFSLELDRGL